MGRVRQSASVLRLPRTALLLSLWSAQVEAQSVDGETAATENNASAAAEAREQFRRGVRLSGQDNQQDALAAFERAYELAPNFRLLYNIGVSQLALEHYADAFRSLSRYLADGAGEVPADRRTAVTTQIEELGNRVGTVSVSANVDGADMTLDGNRVGQTPLEEPVVVDLGLHILTIEHADYVPHVERINIAGRDMHRIAVVLRSIERPVEPPVVERSDTLVVVPRDAAPEDSSDGLLIAGAIATGAFAVAGTVFGVLALGAQGDLHDALDQYPANPDAVDGVRGDLETYGLVFDLMMLGTLLAGATTLVLWVVGKSEGDGEDAVTATFGPGGVLLSHSF